MSSSFAHLHLHTQYSLLDGVNKIPDVLKLAASLGQPAIAMTDHGNLHGAVQFYQAAKEHHIKPILGCELYVTPSSRFEKKTRAQGGAGSYHLTVLARDITGYRNLCRLVTLAYREGFYFKPRVDHELLKECNEGLIVLSGCLASEVGHFAGLEDLDAARKRIDFYASTFDGRYFLEIQPHQIHEQQNLNALCRDIARSKGIPLVATTDCHYCSADDHFAQEVLMCISTGKQVTDPDRIRHEGVDLHLKTEEEMLKEFGAWDGAAEALAQAGIIAEQCNVEFDFSTYYMPRFDADDDQPLIELMAERAREGLEIRIQKISELRDTWQDADRQEYLDRLEEEIELIDKMGFAGYFLVVADFIVWAKEKGIPVGPGRGSAAGSLVAYAMRITDIDPIENKLLFERFLNPERVSLPDIDVDFCIHGRDQVIQYVVEKYGKEKVAQIATFGTLKAKAAIKDVGRALGISYAETDRIAQLVPAPRQGFDVPLAEALKVEKRLKEYAEGEGGQLIELALKLEGLTRHTSTHAAGVVIGDRPLVELLPLMVDKDGNDVTQYSMKYVEKVGLVKFDFLGLKTLTVIQTAIDLIKESQNVRVDLETLPLNDPKTYELLCAGNTTGVFQLESTGIAEMTMRLRPSCFDDLVAILALYRPGPLDAGMVDHYISRKHGREPVSYQHPRMEEILADTYGIILYQEQIMQLARELAGYSLGDADLLRRAMGKKIPEEMAKQRDRFVGGATERSIERSLANEIFDQMETFARYGFNRSHSAAYAMISFQTAYLKAHYPVEFMAAVMTHEMGDSDKTLKNLNECRKQGIEVLPPDVNVSGPHFTVSGDKIRYGLSAVKGVGEKAVLAVEEARKKDGSFEDLEDFTSRVDLRAVNRRVVESFVKCGAFDFCGLTRSELFSRVEEAIRAGQSLQRDRESNQIGLFGGGDDGLPGIPRRTTNRPEWPINKLLALEREALGFYISGHPLTKYKRFLKQLNVVATDAILKAHNKREIKVGGVVTQLRLKNTRKGDRYATFLLEDWVGSIEAIVWPDVYREVAHLMVADEPIVVTGRADVTDERRNLVIDKIEKLIDLRDRDARFGLIRVSDAANPEQHFPILMDIFAQHSGTCPIKMIIDIDGNPSPEIALKAEDGAPICVSPSEELCEQVERVFGAPVLSFSV